MTTYTITATVLTNSAGEPTSVRVSNVTALTVGEVRPIAEEALARHMGSYNMATLGHGMAVGQFIEYEVGEAPAE